MGALPKKGKQYCTSVVAVDESEERLWARRAKDCFTYVVCACPTVEGFRACVREETCDFTPAGIENISCLDCIFMYEREDYQGTRKKKAYTTYFAVEYTHIYVKARAHSAGCILVTNADPAAEMKTESCMSLSTKKPRACTPTLS